MQEESSTQEIQNPQKADLAVENVNQQNLSQNDAVQKDPKVANVAKISMPPIPEAKVEKPTMFGYKPPVWGKDYEYIKMNKGKGDPSDSETWVLFNLDRLLKMHST